MAKKYGIIIGPSKKNLSEAKSDEILFDSTERIYKIHQSGEKTVTQDDKTVEHNLGYVPFCLVWAEFNSDGLKRMLPAWNLPNNGNITSIKVDGTNLYIGGLLPATYSFVINYVIFKDKIGS